MGFLRCKMLLVRIPSTLSVMDETHDSEQLPSTPGLASFSLRSWDGR